MANVTDVATTAGTDTSPAGIPVAGSTPGTPTERRRVNWKKWRARLVVLLMIAGAVYGGTRLAESRTGALSRFDLGTVTLTAQAIGVQTRQTGQVTAVNVVPQQKVTAGQRLGTIVTSTLTASGKEKLKSVPLAAPADGIVSSQPQPIGSIVTPGNAFVQLYDPAHLTFDTKVRVQDLSRLSPGMVATLHADGLDRPIEAVIQRVVPQVVTEIPGAAPAATQSRLEVVLVPKRAADVAGLVPGLRFTGTVDTATSGGPAVSGLHLSSR